MPDTQGRWFHVKLDVTAPAGRYKCAVDVDSKQTTTGVQWRTSRIHSAQLPVEEVARRVGFGTAAALRERFVRRRRVPPRDYRRTFAAR